MVYFSSKDYFLEGFYRKLLDFLKRLNCIAGDHLAGDYKIQLFFLSRSVQFFFMYDDLMYNSLALDYLMSLAPNSFGASIPEKRKTVIFNRMNR